MTRVTMLAFSDCAAKLAFTVWQLATGVKSNPGNHQFVAGKPPSRVKVTAPRRGAPVPVGDGPPKELMEKDP
jgi:hypothetical protein